METMNGIEAGLAESRGEGSLSVTGRKITYRSNNGMTFSWSCATDKQAREQLAIFRAAPKYVVA